MGRTLPSATQFCDKGEQERLTNLITRPIKDTLGITPSFAEMLAAVSQLKKGKAPGPDGMQPEMIMFLTTANLRIMYEMMARVWEGVEPIPAEWKANYLVLLPKSGVMSRSVIGGEALFSLLLWEKSSAGSLMADSNST